MIRVLIITYYWPPSGGSGVQRWVKFTKYLPSQGIIPVIYTPDNPDITSIDRTLEDDIPQEAEIIKRHITEFYWLYRLLRGRKAKDKKEVNPINGGKKSFLQKLMLFIRGNMFIPDPRITWMCPSVRFLKRYLKKNPVDVIISTGPPQSMHLIAMKVAKATSTPWVADFRDPWTKIFYFKHLPLLSFAKKKHDKLEKTVIDSADAVVTVSPSIRREFQEMTSTPVHLITNGYDAEDFEQIVEPDGFFNITHTGLLVKDGNPQLLWQILAEKCRKDEEFAKYLRIRLTGNIDKEVLASIKASGLEDKMINLGYQKHLVAIREQKNASMLILPLREEPEKKGILPGKLFEYLASRRPVLCIGLAEGDIAKVLDETHSGRAYEWDDKSMAEYIDLCWLNFKNGNYGNQEADIYKYSRKALTAVMASLLKSISEQYRNENK